MNDGWEDDIALPAVVHESVAPRQQIGMAPLDCTALLAHAKQAKARHKETSFCEFPSTCGGCHFWSGYISALEDIIGGRDPFNAAPQPAQTGGPEIIAHSVSSPAVAAPIDHVEGEER